MTTVAMWSGGKDSCLAVWRFGEVDYLLCMAQKGRSRAHGIDVEIIREQGRCMGFEMIIEEATWEEYEERLKRVFKEYGVDRAVFGDIYLEEHREWIERVCGEVGVKPVFPLWGESTKNLAKEFVEEGFEAYIIAVRKEFRDLLGRKFDLSLLEEIERRGIDPCGENGEFHTIVVDGPLFKRRLNIKFGGISENEKYIIQKLIA